MRRLVLLAAAARVAARPGRRARPFALAFALPQADRPARRVAARGHRHRQATRRFYVGSIPTGAVYRGDLRTRRRARRSCPAHAWARRHRAQGTTASSLWVAGGPTGKAFVYDARTGADVRLSSVWRPGRRSSTTSRSGTARPLLHQLRRAAKRGFRCHGRRCAAGPCAASPLTGDFVQTGVSEPPTSTGSTRRRHGTTIVLVQNEHRQALRRPTRGPACDARSTSAGPTCSNGDGILLRGRDAVRRPEPL